VIRLVKYRDNQCVNCAEQKFVNEAFTAESKEALVKSKEAAKYEQKRRDNHTKP
jgi:hypothetical protein